MKTDSRAQDSKEIQPSTSLAGVIDQSEEAKVLVVQAAEELSTVNSELKQELNEGDASPGVENALEKSVAVEDKVQEASEKLEVVHLALKEEVKERHILEDQLVAVTEQGTADRLALEDQLVAVTEQGAADVHALEGQLAAVTEQGAVDRHAAFHDVLTGLPNRALFNDRLEHGIAQARRHGWALAVMFVDLDEFKIINDTHGHDIGDFVLRTIALRLKAETRSDDTVSRLGGDEFLYLLMEVRDEKDVTLIAEKIIKSVQAPCDVVVDQVTLVVSVKASIGIAVFPKAGDTPEVLIKSADTAMYEAKKTKSGYSFAQ